MIDKKTINGIKELREAQTEHQEIINKTEKPNSKTYRDWET